MGAQGWQFGAGRAAAFRRAALVAILALVASFALALAPLTSASAMVQVGTSTGYPGDPVTVEVQNQSRGPAFTPWIITAPPGTTIVSAAGAAASGLTTFACSGSGGQTSCGPSANGGWGVNNIVTLQLAIAPTAVAGPAAGASTIAAETGTYTVTVLAPPAPDLTAPATGTRTLDTQPTVSGTKRSGNAAAVTIDGTQVCTVAADAATTWSCAPGAALAVGQHTITATQTSPGGDASPASAPSTIEVIAPAALAVSQAGPTEAVPTVAVTRTVVVENTGPGTSIGVTARVDLGGFPATTCTVGGVTTDCATLATGVALGDLASGSRTVITLAGSIADATPVGTAYPITATADSISDAASPVSSSSSLTAVAPDAPVIERPVRESRITDRTPVISGTNALAGATVSVDAGPRNLCRATADSLGRWSCTTTAALPLGQLRIAATAALGGAASGQSLLVEFFVVRPPVPPVAVPPAPPTQSPPPVAAPPGSSSGAPGGAAPTAPGPPQPAPTQPAPSQPAPNSSPPSPPPASGTAPGASGAGGSDSTETPGSGLPNGSAPVTPLPVDLHPSTNLLVPGTVASLRGSLGPNGLDAPAVLTLQATMSPGLVYRTVAITTGGTTAPCTIATTSFSCVVTLESGQSADVEIRIYADPVNAPDIARQQLTLTAADADQSNAMTTSLSVAGATNDSEQLADVITTFNITTFPGAFIPLLSMLLLALAATVTEAGRRRSATAAAATPSQSPPGESPPADSPPAETPGSTP